MFHKWKLSRNRNISSPKLDILDKRTSMWKPILILLPAISVLVLFVVIPFVTAVNDGVHYTPKGTHSHRASDKIFGFHNFRLLFDDPAFSKSVSNSLLYALISIPLIMTISLIISSAISTLLRKKMRGFWQTIFFLPYVTSAIAIGLTFAYIFDYDKGFMNKVFNINVPWLVDSGGHSAFFALLIYGVWKGLAFNILIFTTAMLGIDKKLYKSASIDGAGPARQFFTITIPAIKPTISFLFTMGLIGAIKVFPLALFQNNPQDAINYNGSTLLLYVYKAIKVDQNYGLAGAASVMLLVISVGFAVIVRNGVKLIMLGSRKVGEKRVQNKIEATKSA